MERQDSQNLTAPPDPPHNGFRKPYEFKYPILQLNLYGVLGLLLFVPILSNLTVSLQGGNFPILLTTFYHAIGVMLVGFLTILVHEQLHGFVMTRFGYKPASGSI